VLFNEFRCTSNYSQFFMSIHNYEQSINSFSLLTMVSLKCVNFLIIMFIAKVKNWTFNSSLFKPIIYFVTPSGHKDKWYIKFNLPRNVSL
jgi:hypothetical protein